MANRPGVQSASLPITAIDTVLLSQQMLAALARVPVRRPLQGPFGPAGNLAYTVSREVLRSFMGYASSLPVPEFRSIERLLDDLCRVVAPPLLRPVRVAHRAVELGGVPGIAYEPREAPVEGVILYLHGGGYIGTSPSMYAFAAALLCRQTRCAVFVADYRLAPEFPFPAGVEDAGRVLTALVDGGVPPERLFVAGDSGGGGLATTLVLGADHGLEAARPAGVILFSPEVDLALDDPSITDNTDQDILPWNIPTTPYLRGVDANNPWVSPVNADLSGFPPTAVSWGGNQMFRDSIRRFAARLAAAGVPTEAKEVPGMFHDFQILVPWSEGSRAVLAHVDRFVDKVVATAPPLELESLATLAG